MPFLIPIAAGVADAAATAGAAAGAAGAADAAATAATVGADAAVTAGTDAAVGAGSDALASAATDIGGDAASNAAGRLGQIGEDVLGKGSDIGKQFAKGLEKGNDIFQKVNGNGNGNDTNNPVALSPEEALSKLASLVEAVQAAKGNGPGEAPQGPGAPNPGIGLVQPEADTLEKPQIQDRGLAEPPPIHMPLPTSGGFRV